MNLTVDASVFVASARITEREYLTSRRFLQQARSVAAVLFCPILVLPECAAAIARSTGDPMLAQELVGLIWCTKPRASFRYKLSTSTGQRR